MGMAGERRNNSLPPRATLWILGMFSVGTLVLLLGLGQYYDEWFGESDKENSAGLSMIGLGALMCIPGSYGAVVLFGSWRRWEGYSYDQLPNYGDDQ